MPDRITIFYTEQSHVSLSLPSGEGIRHRAHFRGYMPQFISDYELKREERLVLATFSCKTSRQGEDQICMILPLDAEKESVNGKTCA